MRRAKTMSEKKFWTKMYKWRANKVKREVRKTVKEYEERIRYELDELVKSDSRSFWSKLKKMSKIYKYKQDEKFKEVIKEDKTVTVNKEEIKKSGKMRLRN